MSDIKVISRTQHILVNPVNSSIVITNADLQRIVINQASSSVSVINTGPMGPRGLVGPPDAGSVLTVDGQLLTRAAGVLAPVTRANLAADTAFTEKYVAGSVLTVDGQLLTRAGGVLAPVTRANLAVDTAFTEKYVAGIKGAGAPTGTGTDGDYYYDTTNKRLWRSNGTQWVFERAYDATKRPGVVLIGAGQVVGAGASVTVSWSAETSDVDGWISAPNTTLTVPAGWAGCYGFTHRCAGNISSSSSIELTAFVNGGSTCNSSGPFANAQRSNTGFYTGLVAGDTLTFVIFNGSGISITMSNVLVIDWLYR